MPESKGRGGAAYTPPPKQSNAQRPSPPWLAPAMTTFFVLGVLWLAVFYITNNELPIMSDLGNWNLAVGFALIAAGFALSTRWR